MNDVDDRLHADADAWWRSQQPRPRAADAVAVDIKQARCRHLIPLGAAAAVVTLVAAIAVTNATSGNGSRGVSGFGPGQPTAPASTDPLETVAPPWASGAYPSPVTVPLLTPSESKGLVSLPWRFIQSGPSGRTIDVLYVGGDGDCVTPAGFEVAESSNAVEVWALSQNAGHRKACADGLQVLAGTITLQTPLGGRTLLHGPVDKQWVNTARALGGA